ncbi:ATP-binding protein [Streptomyces ziwulingensis]|uniref:ATP-binding protein n=1 Tax=Streptomyces ziwulingensis TaxID=1045501 RepID=A0ABP9C9N6_9ACTN
MKQSAAKTLGVAALGAAFAAAGAGAATAAPGVPDAAQTLGGLTRTLPTETVTQALPGGAAHVLGQGQRAAGTGLTAAQPVVEQLVAEQLANGPTGPLGGLLGGLPVQGGLPLNGVPVA